MINSGTQVMVVDDDTSLRNLIATLLKGIGIDAILVKDGQTALTLLEEGLIPSLIILDLILPGIDGFSVLARIRQLRALDTVPVVILSAMIEPETIRHGLALGADAYVTKPYVTHSLLDRVRVLIAAGRRPQAQTRLYTRTAPLTDLSVLGIPHSDSAEAGAGNGAQPRSTTISSNSDE